MLITSLVFLVSRDSKASLPSVSELSEMSGSECLNLFEEHGLVLPDEYKNNRIPAEKDVEYILDEMQNSSTSNLLAISRAGMHELAEEIEKLLSRL